MSPSDACELFDARHGGLPAKAVDDLADRLRRVGSRCREGFTTTPRDTREDAWVSLRGVLTMDTECNCATIARLGGVSVDHDTAAFAVQTLRRCLSAVDRVVLPGVASLPPGAPPLGHGRCWGQ